MPDELQDRVTRLEEHERHVWATLDRLADRQGELDGALVTLAEGLDRLEHQVSEMVAHSREVDTRIDKLAQRMDQLAASQINTNSRIDGLVSAIGEFIRAQGARQVPPANS